MLVWSRFIKSKYDPVVIILNTVYHVDTANIQQDKQSYTKTFWKTNEQRNKIKNSQHYS